MYINCNTLKQKKMAAFNRSPCMAQQLSSFAKKIAGSPVFRQPGYLLSFETISHHLRPVAFRPHLTMGLALSGYELKNFILMNYLCRPAKSR
jgi:hypothetical protein